MYSEQDMRQVNAALRRDCLVLGPVAAILLGAYVYALAARVKWLAFVAGGLLFVVVCYGFMTRLLPMLRYRRFLRDMAAGLSREVKGTILSVSDAAEPQDGALVHAVRIRLEQDGTTTRESLAAERLERLTMEDTRDERILYINASKRAMLPEPGAVVTLSCFGRHIKAVRDDGR